MSEERLDAADAILDQFYKKQCGCRTVMDLRAVEDMGGIVQQWNVGTTGTWTILHKG